MNLLPELECSLSIALDAAALIRDLRTNPLQVNEKLGGEPVTNADLATNDLVVARLRAAYPADAILSEELPDISHRKTASRVWMIDPIDGTRDFIRGEPGYAVMIGLCLDGQPVLGVVSQPATGITWLGVVGRGAWQLTAGHPRQQIVVSSTQSTSAIRLVTSKSHRGSYYDRFCSLLGIKDELRVGSVGVKMGLIADGSRDLYVYPGSQTKLWDTCAPHAILAAAGGCVTDTQGSQLVYTGDSLNNSQGLVASNGHLHPAVLDAIHTIRSSA